MSTAKEREAPSTGEIPCPFCAERIQPDAVLCRHCRSSLVASDGRRLTPEDARQLASRAAREASSVSLWQALGANLLVPGYGTWKLGHRMRGLVLLVLVLVCFSLDMKETMDVIKTEMPKAMKTGQTKVLERKLTEAGGSGWGTAAFALYLYTFLDAWLVRPRQKS